MKKVILFLLGCCVYLACTPTTASKTNSTQTDTLGITPLSPATTLANEEVLQPTNLEYYLNKTAGVFVQGSGSNAYVGRQGAEPLFVVNGNEVGSSFQAAADYVRLKKIKSVKLLRHLEAEGLYGLRSNNGVIIIKTE